MITRLRDRLRSEDGWVLATALGMMSVMLIVAFSTMGVVDVQQKRDRQQRERESSLNLSEGVLSAQGFALAQAWPGTVARAMPASCVSTGASVNCPNPATLAGSGGQANFTNVDQKTGATWTTFVRDNGAPLNPAYDATKANLPQSGVNVQTSQSYTCAAPCTWDANGDKVVWVQARGIVRGKPRNLVAQLKLETLREATPQAAVSAGGITIGNKGNKIMIWAQGSSVVVRCNPSSQQCASREAGQINPDVVQGNPANLMTPSQINRFRERAKADGTYYAAGTCPTDLRGAVVFVEACNSGNMTSGGTSLEANGQQCVPPAKPGGGGTGLQAPCTNLLSRPGILVWHCGKLDFRGNWTYVGVIYAANNSDGTCPAGYPTLDGGGKCGSNNPSSATNVVSISGGFGIWGALAIDGPGCLYAGNNGLQVQFDPNVFNAVSSYGTVGLVQNTWRELYPS